MEGRTSWANREVKLSNNLTGSVERPNCESESASGYGLYPKRERLCLFELNVDSKRRERPFEFLRSMELSLKITHDRVGERKRTDKG
jgi:hypothetical protein